MNIATGTLPALRPTLSPLKDSATTVSTRRCGIFKRYDPELATRDVLQKAAVWEVGTASTFRAFDVSLQGIESLYTTLDRRAVREFILENRDLAEVLLDAFEPLTEAFGPFPHVCLSIIHDPEIEKSAELLAAILTPLDAAEALKRLAQFDEWFLTQLKRTKGRLIFDLEFV